MWECFHISIKAESTDLRLKIMPKGTLGIYNIIKANTGFYFQEDMILLKLKSTASPFWMQSFSFVLLKY